MRIAQFDPKTDSARLRACYDMFAAAQPDDDPDVPAPSLAMFTSWWTHDDPGEARQFWLAATAAGDPLGCYELKLPGKNNRSSGFLELIVTPAARRRGTGTALLAHAGGQAARAGRKLLMGAARAGSAGTEFAAAAGATPGLQDARRILDVTPDLHARLPALRADADARAAGYPLRRWAGATPKELAGGVCALISALADAPHDASYEPATWDEDDLAAGQRRAESRGSRQYSVAAFHEQTGEMAALTQVLVDPHWAPGWAQQQITAVTRPHRGHRLGMAVKAEMLVWLAEAEPDLRHIVTYNAVPNQYMIAVNEALGHRVSDYFQSYELTAQAAARLAVPA